MEKYSKISYVLETFILPILIVFGFISNTISFFVMRRAKNSSTAKYMAFLSLADSGVLILGCLNMFSDSFFKSTENISLIRCKLIPFMFYSFADFSVLIIVLMTFDRFYGIWHPFKAKILGRTKIIRLNLLFGCMLCLLVNFHLLYSHSAEVNESANSKFVYACEYLIWRNFYEHYWIFIDSFIYSFIPSFLVCILNILIIIRLKKADKITKKLKQKTKSSKKLIQIKRKIKNVNMDCVEQVSIEKRNFSSMSNNKNEKFQKKSEDESSTLDFELSKLSDKSTKVSCKNRKCFRICFF